MSVVQRFCFLSTLIVLGLLIGQPTDQGGAAEPKDQVADIQKLIDDLDSTQFDVRERATAKLLALEEKALPALRDATRTNPGLEKLRRLESIVARTEQLLRDRQIAKL